MRDTKPASQSMTIIANVLTMVALLLGLYFKEFGPDQQAAFVDAGVGVAVGVLQLVSMWGRIRASQRIQGIIEK